MALLLHDALFHDSTSRKLFAAFASATMPLLAEAAITSTVCGAYLLKGPPKAVAIPTFIRSILVINVLLTLLLLCATLGEGFFVSANFLTGLENYANDWYSRVALAATDRTATRVSAGAQMLQSLADEFSALKNERGSATALELLALGLVWMVVALYVGCVACAGLRVACQQAEGDQKGSWSLQAVRKIVHMMNRSKWVGLCFAFFFSSWGFVNGCPLTAGSILMRRMAYIAHSWDADLLAVLRESIYTQRVWNWTVATSTLILLALVALYTIAARIALYASCKRFSLHEADDELACGRSPFDRIL